MTLILELPDEVSTSLAQAAQRHGMTPDCYAVQVLTSMVSVDDRQQQLIELLESRIAGTSDAPDEECNDDILRMIDEDRLSSRPLFPQELKGITW